MLQGFQDEEPAERAPKLKEAQELKVNLDEDTYGCTNLIILIYSHSLLLINGGKFVFISIKHAYICRKDSHTTLKRVKCQNLLERYS